jgi:hypothetical protein
MCHRHRDCRRNKDVDVNAANKKKMSLLLALAVLLMPAAAQAQYYGARGLPPLYPYELQPGEPYAVEVAPGTYVIHHPRPRHGSHVPKSTVVTTAKVVRERPIVIEHTRVVQDPPRVIVRKHEVVEPPAKPRPKPVAEISVSAKLPSKARPGRVIHADAEVTILGPDRMTIQLYRKGTLGAQASEKKK